jgi:hypothetical protein
LLSQLLGNVEFERLFFDCLMAGTQANLLNCPTETRIDLESVDLSVLSVEALDSLLLNGLVSAKSEDRLLELILKLGEEYRDLLRHIEIGFLSASGLLVLAEHFEITAESLWHSVVPRISCLVLSPLGSLIISDFPAIFAEFRWRKFSLLWRGSRDGFRASDFHDRCDGHANTLTVILDTDGNIFGRFTPVEWESRPWNGIRREANNCFKADTSLKSFVFTLKNPHDIPPKRFPLKSEFVGRGNSMPC